MSGAAPAGELDGKVTIVTGAAGLIGAETARLFAEAGARVVLADIDEAGAAARAEALRARGHEARAFACDLTREDNIAELVRFTVASFGGLDVVDNNAGATTLSVDRDQDLVAMETADWDLIYAINVRGPMLLIKHALPAMFARGGGSIVNISSGAADVGDLAFSAYGSSKSALNTLTKYVATAYGDRGVRCNAVSPGPIRDPNAPPKPMALEQVLLGNLLVPRLGLPQDIAETVLFLAGPRAGFITGQVITVDGGFLSHWPTFAPLRDLRRQSGGPTDNP